uniref:hypothetical protein n=1 Tax=Belnapia moabensis TaxID=365533 RepID=UPI001B80E4FB
HQRDPTTATPACLSRGRPKLISKFHHVDGRDLFRHETRQLDQPERPLKKARLAAWWREEQQAAS